MSPADPWRHTTPRVTTHITLQTWLAADWSAGCWVCVGDQNKMLDQTTLHLAEVLINTLLPTANLAHLALALQQQADLGWKCETLQFKMWSKNLAGSLDDLLTLPTPV